MKTIALRYSDAFAPTNGTVETHREIIEKRGFVWYGKLGNPISKKVAEMIMSNKEPRILLIHSGSVERYWVYIDCIKDESPLQEEYPSYYHDMAKSFKTWFRVVCISEADKNVMSRCRVISSGSCLSEASKYSMNPYFIIEYNENEGN